MKMYSYNLILELHASKPSLIEFGNQFERNFGRDNCVDGDHLGQIWYFNIAVMMYNDDGCDEHDNSDQSHPVVKKNVKKLFSISTIIPESHMIFLISMGMIGSSI